jgi:uncharacterized membrane protein YjgN (DUF898 family)
MVTPQDRSLSHDLLDRIIILVAVVLTVFTITLLLGNLYFQYTNYEQAITQSLEEGFVDYAAVLSLSRAYDFAVLKTSGMFLGYGLIMLGSIFVLRRQQDTYELDLGSAEAGRLILRSSSPGLIVISLGVVLMCTMVLVKQNITYASPIKLERIERPIDTRQYEEQEDREDLEDRDERERGALGSDSG